ncbi:sugar ABC transporter substrate-binding protein [Niallia sp. Krafla_26]|uniref:sugar ABC transporter substrate-binding protein n=1 Tax=Niallia sp. Krafla_26 TaxID=3064703 RepID=UPI003D17D294
MSRKKKQLFITVLTLGIVILGTFIYKQFIVDKPKVFVVLWDSKLEYWDIVKAGAEKGFKDFGMDGKIVVAKNGTAQEQIKILDDVLKEKPDVLVIAPVHSEIFPKLEEFYTVDIPVLFIQTNEKWEKKTAYIGTDNIELGAKEGILMASQLQPGEKVALLGRQSSFEVDRLNGARESLEAAGIEIVVESNHLPEGNEKVNEVVTKEMKSILQEYPDIKGVVTSSDYVALPALRVVQEQGVDVTVMGTGGVLEMLPFVKEGVIPITVSQSPYDMGYLSIETSAKVANGENVNKEIYTSIDIVTKGNAQQRLEFYQKAIGN